MDGLQVAVTVATIVLALMAIMTAGASYFLLHAILEDASFEGTEPGLFEWTVTTASDSLASNPREPEG